MSKEGGGGKEGFQRVANKRDIKEGSLMGVELEGNKIALAMIDGQVFAIDAVCSHKGAPLEQGKLEGYNLTCPWHYAVFDVRNGKVSDRTVWAKNQTSYPVNVDESTGDILINVAAGIRQKGGKEATDDTTTT
jgi:nitrite reductase/ring-hydroxylating ferredoxin subunit